MGAHRGGRRGKKKGRGVGEDMQMPELALAFPSGVGGRRSEVGLAEARVLAYARCRDDEGQGRRMRER